MKTQKTRTPQEIKSEWFRKGITQSQWAHQNGFPGSAVSQVLNGKNSCKKGTGHRIAVALGLKDGDILETSNHE